MTARASRAAILRVHLAVQAIGKSFVPVAPIVAPFALDAWHLDALVLVVVTARTVQGMAHARSG